MTAIVVQADARRLPLPDQSVDLIVTSPPYFALRSYTDKVECARCRELREGYFSRNAESWEIARNLREAWPDYDAHVAAEHKPSHYAGQIGSEPSPAEWLEAMWEATREMVRVLKPEGSIWVNLGDKYSTGTSGDRNTDLNERWGNASGKRTQELSQRRSGPVKGMPPKCLLGLPWRYAIGCIDQLGLILRAELIWSKPNGLPESVTDRVRRSHETWFHFTRQPRYYSAVEEIREAHAPKTLTHRGGGQAYGNDRNPDNQWGNPNGKTRQIDPLGKLPGSVWSVPSEPLQVPPELGVDHFAAFPTEWPRRLILGWSPPGICVECGTGRRPVIIKGAPFPVKQVAHRRGNYTTSRNDNGAVAHAAGWEFNRWRAANPNKMVGHICDCAEPSAYTRPAVVLDPFGGTGTTALVASVLGRVGISVDLSADYTRLARWRTTNPGERAKAMRVAKPPVEVSGQDSLFEITEPVSAAKLSGGLAYAEKKGRNCATCGYRTQYAKGVCDRCGTPRAVGT